MTASTTVLTSIWSYLRVRIGMRRSEFDQLELHELLSILDKLEGEDRISNMRDANLLWAILAPHSKKKMKPGDFFIKNLWKHMHTNLVLTLLTVQLNLSHYLVSK